MLECVPDGKRYRQSGAISSALSMHVISWYPILYCYCLAVKSILVIPIVRTPERHEETTPSGQVNTVHV